MNRLVNRALIESVDATQRVDILHVGGIAAAVMKKFKNCLHKLTSVRLLIEIKIVLFQVIVFVQLKSKFVHVNNGKVFNLLISDSKY